MWRCPKTAYAERLSAAYIKCVFAVAALPAPLTPDFRVADNSAFKIDQSCLKQRSQSEDDGGRVASGVGHQARLPDRVPVQFGATVDGLGLQCSGEPWDLRPSADRHHGFVSPVSAMLH